LRVDNWDEEEIAAPAPKPATKTGTTTPEPVVAEVAKVEAADEAATDEAEPPRVNIIQGLRTGPTWLMLVAVCSIVPIILMVLTIFLLIAFK
jgi:hypothetical protein